MVKKESIPYGVVQVAALMAIGEVLDEIIYHFKNAPIDKKHKNFWSKFFKWIEFIQKDNLPLSFRAFQAESLEKKRSE
jgi:hypothetical protein